MEGEAAEAALVDVLLAMAQGGPRPVSREDLVLEEFRKRTVVTVVTEPGTLRPREASSESRDLLRMDGERREQVERNHYTFAWD